VFRDSLTANGGHFVFADSIDRLFAHLGKKSKDQSGDPPRVQASH
jgi:hypothetical protein